VNAPTTDLLGVVRPNPSGSSLDIGAYENSLSTTPYPAAVSGLTAVGGSGSVTLTWNTVADADSAYKVYQHTSAFTVAAAYYVGATSAKTTPHDTTYTITGLDNTTRYYFRVSAVNKESYEGTSSALDITPTYSGPVWWVSTTGNDDTGDGGTGKPFKTLKHAIEHVTAGDTVMLKKGTYTGDGNRAIEITANNSAIDFANLKNVVITSEEGAANTIIHANDRDRHFTISGNSSNTIDSTFQFIGLTFEGGKRSDHAGSFYIYANRNYDNNINMDRASLMQPKFKDCVFKDNQAIDNNYGSYGGAFWIENAAPIFENCVFDSNYANRGGGAINIGGGGNVYKDTTWIRNTTFKNNWADDVGTSNNVSVSGGAIWLDHGMNIIIDKSTFQNNSVIQKNADHGLNGGAIAISNSWDAKNKPRVYITNSRFTKNEVRHENGGNAFGGAIYAGAPFTMKNTLIDSNKSGVTSGQGGNRGHGGGLYLDLNAYWDQNGNQVKGNTYLINNTIADNYASGNQAGEAGGIFINHGNETFGTWFNNIIWGNRTDHPEAQRQNLSMHDENTFGIFADYNDVEYSTHYPFFMGSNSYDIDPAFYSATNYQLGTGSPLIGAGKASFDGINVPSKDILGNARPNPSDSNPDLGAYENALAESPYPKQVTNLVGTFGSSQVSLSWDANTETDIDKYIVYASTVKDYTPA
ncbi:MAG: fibronectin type III domain-containing protein, partial [Candidatus Marinimicrobia bacterium]|nr:fibronectin type III domain-containing protein [Candidatus Neomarinimicrobiota bacterium]